ncbi:C4-dicarboxylate transporter DctM subunit [Rhodoligotrophos appendicifer]|uniref:TRAP transporter large permease n=1 Tax=Rhodoligotrophos appendicifer TaxID=987056 RepID=UPI00117CDA3A|nr:TRAP transporter large permease [Rhodoligotrophos appendicifer]
MWLIGGVPFVFLLIGFPIFILLLATALLLLGFAMPMPSSALHQVMFGSLDKFSLLAIPFFIFAGELMARGSMSRRIIEWVLALLGGRRGAMPLATVGASTVFGALSGSSPATVAAIGRLMYPNLRSSGYNESFSSGLITAAGGIAIVIPPSIAMILYCVSAEQSVSQLFLAGIIPGLFLALLMGLYIYVYAWRMDIRESSEFSIRRLLEASRNGFWALLTPLIVLGGIYSGVFSPTEAAGIACVYALIVTLLIYRDLTFADVWRLAIDSAALTGQIMIIVAAAGVVSWLVTVLGLPQQIVAAIQDVGAPVWLFLLMMNILLLIVGCFIDPISAILVLTPLLVPIAKSLGIDLIHFGLIMTVNLSIGMFSPPFGLNIFVAQATLGVKTSELYRGLLPFIGVYLLGLAILTAVPEMSLFLLRFFQ